MNNCDSDEMDWYGTNNALSSCCCMLIVFKLSVYIMGQCSLNKKLAMDFRGLSQKFFK